MADVLRFHLEPECIREIIEEYKNMPCLWNMNCPQRKDRIMKHEAIKKLTKIVKKYEMRATHVDVMKKIESLRACHRKERNKVEASRTKYPNNPKMHHTPRLWYYDLLDFLNTADSRMGTRKKLYPDLDTVEVTKIEIDDETQDGEPQYLETEDPQYIDDEYPIEYEAVGTSSMVSVTEKNPLMVSKGSGDGGAPSKRGIEVMDEYDAIGINVAAKLRNIPQNMRILAEKLISDALFQAQMNQLTPTSTITSKDPLPN